MDRNKKPISPEEKGAIAAAFHSGRKDGRTDLMPPTAEEREAFRKRLGTEPIQDIMLQREPRHWRQPDEATDEDLGFPNSGGISTPILYANHMPEIHPSNYERMIYDQPYGPHAIRTYTGKAFDVENIDIEDIDIEDIAHALAHKPRFAGHLPRFYSVAQHCCWVSDLVPEELRLEALLHDASEAYLPDVPKPIKTLLPDFNELETRIMSHIALKFNISYPLSLSVKAADFKMLCIEWNGFIMGAHQLDYWPAELAKQHFLEIYTELTHINS